METTLEIRWFIKGIPPATVQNWFKFECLGELLRKNQAEIRKDWYCCRNWHDLEKLEELSAIAYMMSENFNLKLRQGNLELKWRKQQLDTEKFVNRQNLAIWQGNIEQWCKLRQEELSEFNLSVLNSESENYWVAVNKQREQKIEKDIASELTWLEVDGDRWWSLAFEMAYNPSAQQVNNYFKRVIKRACQKYYGPQLSTNNSYSYAHWLLELQHLKISD